jgi:transposase-like protein
VDVALSRRGFGISTTLEFRLSATRDAEAAKACFAKTLAAPHTTTPGVITVDNNAASPRAISELKIAFISSLFGVAA